MSLDCPNTTKLSATDMMIRCWSDFGMLTDLRAAVTQHGDTGLAGRKQVQAVHQILDVATPPNHHQALGLRFGHWHAVPDTAVPLVNKAVKLPS